MFHNKILELRDSLHIHACEWFYFERYTTNVESTVNVPGKMSISQLKGYFSVYFTREPVASHRKNRESPELKCYVTAGAHETFLLTCLSRVLCGCFNLLSWARIK